MSDPFLPTARSTTAASTETALRQKDAVKAGAAAPAMDRRVAASRWARWRRWRLPMLGVVLVGLGWAAIRLVPASGTLVVAGDQVTVSTAVQAPFQDYLPVRATIAPQHSVFLDALEGGQVAQVSVLDGAAVRAGDTLATLSNPQLQLDVASREAAITGQLGNASAEQLTLQQSLATERSAIGEASYDLLKAQRNLSVRRELQGQGFESDASVKNFSDEAQYYSGRLGLLRAAYARDTALAQLQDAQIADTRTRLQGNLAGVQASLQALVVRAPFAGILTDFQLQPGQTVRQGDRLGQIDSADAFRLDADIDEFYLGRVSVGEAATVTVDGTTAPLRVTRVRPQVSNGQFRAELSFSGRTPPGLRRGETADLRITLGQTQVALVVANGPWLDAGGGNSIFVVDADGRHATRRAISCGRRNPEQVEITAGLAAGARVITSSSAGSQGFSRLSIQ